MFRNCCCDLHCLMRLAEESCKPVSFFLFLFLRYLFNLFGLRISSNYCYFRSQDLHYLCIYCFAIFEIKVTKLYIFNRSKYFNQIAFSKTGSIRCFPANFAKSFGTPFHKTPPDDCFCFIKYVLPTYSIDFCKSHEM